LTWDSLEGIPIVIAPTKLIGVREFVILVVNSSLQFLALN